MNSHELSVKVVSAMYKLLEEKDSASPAEVLIEIGALTKENYNRWLNGKTDYLERVCTMNLSKLSAAMREIKKYAREYGLKESVRVYKKQGGKTKNVRLRFSKYGAPKVERWYATHYISRKKAAEAKEHKEFQKRKNELVGTIAPCGAVCGLCGEVPNCKGCLENGSKCSVGCSRRECCAGKRIRGCWKCDDFPCAKNEYSQTRGIKLKAFVRCAKEDGLKGLAGYVLRNQDNGILYHRDAENHIGDYDGFDSEDAVLELLRTGKK